MDCPKTVAQMVLLAGLLAGCGADVGIGSPPTAASSHLLALVTSAGELKTFDPDFPADAAVTVDTAVEIQRGQNAFRAVVGGTYRAADNSLADGHIPAIVYVKANKVFRLNLSKLVSPTPVQVSAATDACRILSVFNDFSNADNTRLLIETAGVDTDCNAGLDNGRVYFRLGDDDSTTPSPVAPSGFEILSNIYGADGSLQSVLVREGPSNARMLRRYSASLGSPQTITNLASNTSIDFGGPRPSGDLFYFHLQPAPGYPAPCLYRYNAASNQLSACLHPYTNNRGLVATSDADASYIYFAVGNVAYRLSHTGTSLASVRTAPGTYTIRDLRLSSGRVILNITDASATPSSYRIESIPRSGNAGDDALTLTAGRPNALTLSAISGNRVYFVDPITATATSVREDGANPAILSNAAWGGFSLSTKRWSLGRTNGFLDPYHGLFIQAAGNSLVNTYSVDANAGVVIASLGQIANVSQVRTFTFGRHWLVEVTIVRAGSPSTSDTDVYFVDTLKSSSLKPLATTAGANANDRIAN